MKVSVKTADLKEKILKPINRLVEDCILTISENSISSIASLDSGGIFVFVKKNIDVAVDTDINLNIKNINKLISVLNCVSDDMVNMVVESNHIKYDSKSFKFKFHLSEDGVITKPKLKREKIEGLSYTTSAYVDFKEFNSIVKSSALLNAESVRIYFYTKTGEDVGLYCDITNKNIANSDAITIKLSDAYDGDPIIRELICDVEHIRKITTRRDSKLRILFDNNVGYTVFDITDDDGLIRYVMPTLTK